MRLCCDPHWRISHLCPTPAEILKIYLMRVIKILSLLLISGAVSWNVLAQTGTISDPSVDSSSTRAPKKASIAPGSIPVQNLPSQPVMHVGGAADRSLDNIKKARVAADSTHLIFDGDSITDYWQKRGQAVWAQRYARFGAFDFGISGDTTGNVMWRLSQGQADGLHPKLIVLMIGTNNMKFSSTPAEIAAGVKAIISEYQKRCPEAVILLQAIFPRGSQPTDPYRSKIKATNDVLATYADGSKIIYTDFGDKFLDADGTLSPTVMPDYVHPSAKGYLIWADAIQPFIDKYVGK